MTTAGQRGQPLLVFAAILGAWLIGRVLLWESPFPLLANSPARILTGGGRAGPGRPAAQALAVAPVREPPFAGARSLRSPAPLLLPVLALPTIVPIPLRRDAQGAPIAPVPVRRAASQQMLLAVAFSHMELPPEIQAFYAARARAPAGDRPLLGVAEGLRTAASRWSGDGWLLWRDGSGQSVAPGAASYGRSQAGTVVRYRLASGGMRPEAYARATRTLEGPRQAELAAGVSARPFAAVPLRLAAEVRVADAASGRAVRPAAFAVTELAPAALPLGLRAEGYAQAGWVGGAFATAFVDGQVRVDRAVARLGEESELRAGLAAWGGAQKDAARLDIGPSATLGLDLGELRSRLAVDYRVRVAGDAAPGSGPSLTLSAGF